MSEDKSRKPVKEQIRFSKARSTARYNYDVECLTVTRSKYRGDEVITLSAEERHDTEFLLRRMWAISVLHNLKMRNMSWDDIQHRTGKSRQTWYNVTSSGFVPYEILSRPRERSTQRREMIADNNYRPVTNAFIHKVTETLREHGFRTNTPAFRYCFDVGMSVVDSWDATVSEDYTLFNRLGDSGTVLIREWGKPAIVTCVRNADTGSCEPMDSHFPVIGTAIDGNEQHAHDYVMEIELNAYGYDDSVGGNVPDERCKIARQRYKVDEESGNKAQEQFDGYTERRKMLDDYDPRTGTMNPIERNKIIHGVNQPIGDPRINPILGAASEADRQRREELSQMKRTVQLPEVEYNLDMLNPQLQVAFNVVVQFDSDGNVIGKMVMHNPNGGFSVSG